MQLMMKKTMFKMFLYKEKKIPKLKPLLLQRKQELLK